MYHVNFRFKRDGFAYTEEDAVVFNVYINFVPLRVSWDHAYRHFCEYGTILKLQLRRNKKYLKHYKSGFINFSSPESAADVLRRPHRFFRQQIEVKACNSRFQPKPEYDSRPIESDGFDIPILNLNYYLLEAICRRLDFTQQLRFSQVCPTFLDVFKRSSQIQHQTFNADILTNLTYAQIQRGIKHIGPYIRSVCGSYPLECRFGIINLMGEYCVNLRRISMKHIKIKNNMLHRLLRNLKDLNNVQFHGCLINDLSFLQIKRISTLESLVLTRASTGFKGKHLHELRGMRALCISHSVSIETQYFVKMCKSLENLICLDISYCHQLSTEAYQILTIYGKKLEMLKMSCAPVQYQCVAELPKLKHLEIVLELGQSIGIEFLDALVVHKRKQLKYLSITGTEVLLANEANYIVDLKGLQHLGFESLRINDNVLHKFTRMKNLEELKLKRINQITPEGLLSFLSHSIKLKYLNFTGCHKIKDDFICKAIDILRQRKRKNPYWLLQPMIFVAVHTGVSAEMLEHPLCLSSDYLVNIFINDEDAAQCSRFVDADEYFELF